MLKSLQAGRALAAIAVAAFHLSSMIAPDVSLLSHLSRHGNAGVDFFFVLSGFIIFYAHQGDIGQQRRLADYARKRFIRVYPAYWLYTALVVAVGLSGHGHSQLPQGAVSWLSTLSLFRFNDTLTPLNVAWTLFYEIAFYALFGILIFNRRIGVAVIAAWVVLLVVLHRTTPTNSASGVWTSRLCLNFAFGMIACWAHTRIGPRAGAIYAALGVVGLLVAAVLVDRGLGQAFGSVLAVSFTALIAGFAAIERVRPLAFGPLAALGNASYTIYLAHGHIEAPIMRALEGPMRRLRVPPDLVFVGVMALTLAASYGLYLLLEKPLVRRLQSSTRPKAVPAAAPIAGVGAPSVGRSDNGGA